MVWCVWRDQLLYCYNGSILSMYDIYYTRVQKKKKLKDRKIILWGFVMTLVCILFQRKRRLSFKVYYVVLRVWQERGIWQDSTVYELPLVFIPKSWSVQYMLNASEGFVMPSTNLKPLYFLLKHSTAQYAIQQPQCEGTILWSTLVVLYTYLLVYWHHHRFYKVEKRLCPVTIHSKISVVLYISVSVYFVFVKW